MVQFDQGMLDALNDLDIAIDGKIRLKLLICFVIVLADGDKRQRTTIHIDITKRKKASRKRTFQVAFNPEEDADFCKDVSISKRLKLESQQ